MAPKWAKMGCMMSQNRAFLFSEKMFSCFQGMQQCKNRGKRCPKIGVSYFRKKGFRIFGTWRKKLDVHFWAFLIFEKQHLHFGNVFSNSLVIHYSSSLLSSSSLSSESKSSHD